MSPKKGTLSRLKEKERADRVNLILDAAEHVFDQKSFNSVSIQEIADEAGISKSSIYTYFNNQEQLFVETATRNIKNLIETMYHDLNKRKDQYDLEEYINTYVDYMTAHETFYRMMTILMSNPSLSIEAADKINSLISLHLDLLEKFILKDIDYPGGSRLCAHNLFAMLNGLLTSFWKTPGKSEAECAAHMKAVGKVTADFIKFYKTANSRNQSAG